MNRIRCRYQNAILGCTKQSCQFPHIGTDQVTCNNIFYKKCKEYKQNQCEYLHIGPKNTLKTQQNNNSNNENQNKNQNQNNLQDTNVNFDQNKEDDDEQDLSQKICQVCFNGVIQTNYKHCYSSEFCLQCAKRIQEKQMSCPFCIQKLDKKKAQQSKMEKQSVDKKIKQKEEVELNNQCEQYQKSQQNQQIQKDIEQQEKYKRLLEEDELIKKKKEKKIQELIIQVRQSQQLEKELRDKIQQLEEIIRNKEINEKKQQELIQKENFQIEEQAIKKIHELLGLQKNQKVEKKDFQNYKIITIQFLTQSDEHSSKLVRNYNLIDPGFQQIKVEKIISPYEYQIIKKSNEIILEDSNTEQEHISDDSSINSYFDQSISDCSDSDPLDNLSLQRNHGLNIFNHQNFQNPFLNKDKFVVQVKFSLNENFKQIEQEAINKIGQLFDIQQKPLYQKAPNKNGNQTITLEYKTQSEEKSTELVRNFNLFDPGFQTIYVEKKIKPREFWLMRESYEVILESIQSFPRNLRSIFQFMFDNFGEVHRLQIYGKNKKQIQVIFSNEQAYEKFLEELFEEDFYINKDNENENQEPKKYFYFNNQKIYLYQLSQKDIQTKLDLFQQNQTNQNENEYDLEEEQKQQFGSNQQYNNFDQKYYNQVNNDKNKQLETEQEEQGKLFKITNLKNILNVTSKLKEFGDLHHYDYQLKPQQTIEFRYNSIFSDQLMIEAYQNLEFSEIDNMDIKIEMQKISQQSI
ncbi:hypothetical protein PPERSA_02963 [Pseudocohnilembus persalinus]|uniref:RING-type domain-containing protein n=1 Tax=Pseudocohnilembus persalinus TaxID=266149 RepID=A0A0V0QAD6_PSEPJ|nr:hypothetical protein PPERSA_02963 [Pseudocohnilembus persalinus]|eukprot:KRW99131.1 hypothetical protein PPERSA_02963 [Pseudocohnilembus persalinus]